jgi:hypothetical protein
MGRWAGGGRFAGCCKLDNTKHPTSKRFNKILLDAIVE